MIKHSTKRVNEVKWESKVTHISKLELVFSQKLLGHLKPTCLWKLMSVCVWSNSCNDVPGVAQWYGTMAAHTGCHGSVLIMFVMCLHAYVQFCRFDKAEATPDVQWHCNHRPPFWYHYLPAQSSIHLVRISWSIGSEKLFGHVPPMGVEARLPAWTTNTLYLWEAYERKGMKIYTNELGRMTKMDNMPIYGKNV